MAQARYTAFANQEKETNTKYCDGAEPRAKNISQLASSHNILTHGVEVDPAPRPNPTRVAAKDQGSGESKPAKYDHTVNPSSAPKKSNYGVNFFQEESKNPFTDKA